MISDGGFTSTPAGEIVRGEYRAPRRADGFEASPGKVPVVAQQLLFAIGWEWQQWEGCHPVAKPSRKGRFYEGFRMPALTRAEGFGRRAGVRKPQGEETAGR